MRAGVVDGRLRSFARTLRALVAAGADPRLAAAARRDSTPPLHVAVHAQDPELVAALLRAGADPALRDRDNALPLHLLLCSVSSGVDWPCIPALIPTDKRILDQACNFGVDGTAITPLALAVQAGSVGVPWVVALLAAGANPEKPGDGEEDDAYDDYDDEAKMPYRTAALRAYGEAMHDGDVGGPFTDMLCAMVSCGWGRDLPRYFEEVDHDEACSVLRAAIRDGCMGLATALLRAGYQWGAEPWALARCGGASEPESGDDRDDDSDIDPDEAVEDADVQFIQDLHSHTKLELCGAMAWARRGHMVMLRKRLRQAADAEIDAAEAAAAQQAAAAEASGAAAAAGTAAASTAARGRASGRRLRPLFSGATAPEASCGGASEGGASMAAGASSSSASAAGVTGKKRGSKGGAKGRKA
jgi:hypothetical protein